MQFLGRHWRSLLGVAALFEPIWRSIKWLLQWAGNFDFIFSRIQNPSWIGTVINWILDPPGWVTFPAIFAGIILILWDFRRQSAQTRRIPQYASQEIRGAKMSIPLIGMIVSGIAFVGFALWYWTEAPPQPMIRVDPPVVAAPVIPAPSLAAVVAAPVPTTSPIEWHFPTGLEEHAAEAIFGIGSGTAGYWVVYYRLSGTNTSNEPITGVNAYVIPKNTREKLQLKFEVRANEYVDTKDTYGIPPGARFVLAYRIPAPNDGRTQDALTVDEYLEKYGGFTFSFEYDGGVPFVHEFLFADVKTMLLLNKKRHDLQNSPPPAVKKRD